MDLFGPLHSAVSTNRYILVITDAFSKWTEIRAIPNKEASTVAQAFYEEWISRHGVPETVVSDNGLEFCNSIMKNLQNRYQFKHRCTAVAHPQTNSAAESFNRTIIKHMRTFLENNTHEWEEQIPHLRLAYNTRLHKSTQCSPFFLTYFMDPKLPSFDLEEKKAIYNPNWADEAYFRAKEAWQRAKINLEKAAGRQAQEMRKNEKEKLFQEGEHVLVLRPNTPPGENKKFIQPWQNSFQIIKQVGPVTYLVKNLRTKRHSLFHADRLKKDLSKPPMFYDDSPAGIERQSSVRDKTPGQPASTQPGASNRQHEDSTRQRKVSARPQSDRSVLGTHQHSQGLSSSSSAEDLAERTASPGGHSERAGRALRRSMDLPPTKSNATKEEDATPRQYNLRNRTVISPDPWSKLADIEKAARERRKKNKPQSQSEERTESVSGNRQGGQISQEGSSSSSASSPNVSTLESQSSQTQGNEKGGTWLDWAWFHKP